MNNTLKEQDKVRAAIIAGFAKDEQQNVMSYLTQKDILSQCYATKIRVKNETAIIEKVLRKRVEKQTYDIDSITDIIGVRFILLFKQSIPALVENLIGIINCRDSINNPFNNCNILEVIYYTNYHDNENTDLLKKYFQAINKDVDVRISAEGYSSLHIVCRLDTQGNLALQGYKYPIEIQIRTAFEDAWGEIDHKYGYSKRRSNENSAPHPTLNKHLKTLKKFVDACVDYADLIIDESNIEVNHKDHAKILNVPDNFSIIELFTRNSINIKFIEAFEQIIHEKESVINSSDSAGLSNCADKFETLSESYIESFTSSVSEDRVDLFLFYCYENQALCYLASNTEKNLAKSINIYKMLLLQDTENALVQMRLGQALGKAKKFEEGITHLRKAYDNAVNNTTTNFELLEEDLNYILIKTPKLIGYYNWMYIANNIETFTHEQIISNYLEAYEYGLKALESLSVNDTDYIDYLNNIIFYASEIYKLDKGRIDKSIIKAYLIKIQALCSNPATIDASILQTLVNASDFIDNKEDLIEYAKLLKNKIYSQESGFDSKEAIEYLKQIDNILN